MRLSYFFEDMAKAYRTELEDLQSDSEGKNVLAGRLKEKRTHFASLMPMIEVAPEMVAVAFHGAIKFSHPQAMALLSSTEPDDFPSWEELAYAVQFEPPAQRLADIALSERGGEHFLLTTVCLEYLHGRSIGDFDNAAGEIEAGDERGEDGDEGEDIDQDLDAAGADWLEQQGFDRRG
ncbi:MAG: hypothetical protein V7606_4596 [Burkholderiales bacterium]